MEPGEIAEQVRMCAGCQKLCRHICPTFFAWRSDSPTPHGRALLLHQEITGTRPLDDRAIEILYQCLECSHCLSMCVTEIDIAEIVEYFDMIADIFPCAGNGIVDLDDILAVLAAFSGDYRECAPLCQA